MPKQVDEHVAEDEAEFVWFEEDDVISLSRSGNSWMVCHRLTSRLFGPNHCAYQVVHRDARMAAWDIKARVNNVCRDDDEAVQVALRAVRWMRTGSSMDIHA